MADPRPTSFLIVDELFAADSPDFLPALRSVHDPAALAKFADRWLRDPRPWAREQLLAYLDLPFDALGHNPLVKRLFKGAEARGDDDLVGACAVAFDRLVRRVRAKRHRWDRLLRQYIDERYLRASSNTLRLPAGRTAQNPRTLEPVWVVRRPGPGQLLFSHHTRYYLRRRAWRYFRRKGHQRPADYAPAVSGFLARYRDADLAAGEHLLDSWSLLHACFGEHAAITFKAHRAVLSAAGGGGASTLAPAPYFPQLWQDRSAAPVLLRLIVGAQSNLIRVWAAELFRRDHVGRPWTAGLTLDDLTPLLLSPDEPVQLLGAELLATAAGLDRVPLPRWLRLLRVESLTVLKAVAAAVRAHVDPSAVTLFDAVTMANAPAAPVARLGLHFLRRLPVTTPQQRQAVSNVAGLRSAAAAGEVVAWALGVIGGPGVYDVEQVTRFFDSLLPEVRDAAWAWLTTPVGGGRGGAGGDDEGSRSEGGTSAPATMPPAWDDPSLWTRLLETPHEDLRLRLVDLLEQRARPLLRPTIPRDPRGSAPGALRNLGPPTLAPMWAAVLLGIHRGGRRKLAALRQVSDAVRADPASAEVLMPVLAAAIRSVRAPEARAGLAAIVSVVGTRPELESVVARALPELRLSVPAGTGYGADPGAGERPARVQAPTGRLKNARRPAKDE